MSQTVKTKSNCGALGLVNVIHDFERNAECRSRAPRSNASVFGLTSPLGWLPALKA
jgi:hypothetical protein